MTFEEMRAIGRARSPLSEQDVLDMVASRRAGATRRDLMTRFGVGVSTVRKILAGETWSDVTGITGPEPKHYPTTLPASADPEVLRKAQVYDELKALGLLAQLGIQE